jgi:hypothetical protein
MVALLLGLIVLSGLDQTNLEQWKKLQCQGRRIYKRYFNYAEGFSIGIPLGFQGRAGQSAGPERGVAIPLSPDCMSVAVIFGEPNSLDWPKPTSAIDWQVQNQIQGDAQVQVKRYRTSLGNLAAAGVTIHHPATSEIEVIVVAFRPGGGPVYTAHLVTIENRYKRDRQNFRKLLRSFRLEPWR